MDLPESWVGPYWRELDRLGRADEGRGWTWLGTVGKPASALVDPRGLCSLGGRSWSVDWWVGGNDRWHLPAQEAAVRQRLVDRTPVVETVIRVQGGDVVHRAYAWAGGAGDAIGIEVENNGPAPVAVAMAVRPYTGAGPGAIGRIVFGANRLVISGTKHDSGDGSVVLGSAARYVFASCAADGDSSTAVLSGLVPGSDPVDQRCPDGLAQAALVFPLAHGATLRVGIEALPTASRGRRFAFRARRPPPRLDGASVPAAAEANRAWCAQGAHSSRFEIPSDRLADALAPARYRLLMGNGGLCGSDRSAVDLAIASVTAGRYGIRSVDLPSLVDGLADRDLAAADTGAALWALAEHWRMSGDEMLARRSVVAIADAASRMAMATSFPSPDPRYTPRGTLSWTDPSVWVWHGLVDAQDMLACLGEFVASEKVTAWANSYRSALKPDLSGSWLFGGAESSDLPDAGELDLAVPRDEPAHLTLARLGAAMGGKDVVSYLEKMVGQVSPTGVWPVRLGDFDGGKVAGTRRWEGHDMAIEHLYCLILRDCFVAEGSGGIALCRAWPVAWLGRGAEISAVPTRYGILSFAVRWHAERPALLWELIEHQGPRRPGRTETFAITAPGLDPSWSTSETSGEVLLAPRI